MPPIEAKGQGHNANGVRMKGSRLHSSPFQDFKKWKNKSERLQTKRKGFEIRVQADMGSMK